MDFTHMKGFKFLKAILLVLLISCNDNSNIKKETIPTEDAINKIDVIENNLKKKIVLQPKNILSSNSIPKLGHTVNTIADEYLPVLNKNREKRNNPIKPSSTQISNKKL